MIGCTQRLNDRLVLGGDFVSPSLAPPQTARSVEGSAELFYLLGPDRSRWQPTPFVVHLDGVVHGHTLMITRPQRHDDSARGYGRFPTRSDALDPQHRSWFDDAIGVGGDLGRSLIGGAYALGYLVWNGDLGKGKASPTPYKRTRQDGWSSGQPLKKYPEHILDE